MATTYRYSYYDDYYYRSYRYYFPSSEIYSSWDRHTEVPSDIPADVKAVNLASNGIKFLRSAAFENLTECQFLDLAHNDVTIVEKGAFVGLDSLKCIYLQVNNLTVLTSDMFLGVSFS